MEEKPLINILVRTSNRPKAFMQMLNSITTQSYPNIRIIISYDNDAALKYIPKGLEVIQVEKHPEYQFGYDLYCNDLKELVTDGYFFYLDDDNLLRPNVLNELPLEGNGLLVQLQIGNNIVPKGLDFQIRQIGMPCLILHHSLKNLADIGAHGAGDSYWIKKVLSLATIPFVPIIVVHGQYRGMGVCNG